MRQGRTGSDPAHGDGQLSAKHLLGGWGFQAGRSSSRHWGQRSNTDAVQDFLWRDLLAEAVTAPTWGHGLMCLGTATCIPAAQEAQHCRCWGTVAWSGPNCFYFGFWACVELLEQKSKSLVRGALPSNVLAAEVFVSLQLSQKLSKPTGRPGRWTEIKVK